MDWKKLGEKLGDVATVTAKELKKASDATGEKLRKSAAEYEKKQAAQAEQLRIEQEQRLKEQAEREEQKRQEAEEKARQEAIELQKTKVDALSGDGDIAKFYNNKINTVTYDIGVWFEEKLTEKEQYKFGVNFRTRKLGLSTVGTSYRNAQIDTEISYDAKKFLISRSLADVPSKEAGILRIFETLSKACYIEYETGEQIKRAIIYNDGNCTLTAKKPLSKSAEYSKEAFKEFTSSAINSKSEAVEAALGIINDILQSEADELVVNFLQKALTSGNRWATISELLEHHFSTDEGLFLGTVNQGGRAVPIHFHGEGSLITIAPPGSGKTQCNVFPNLATYQGACIVLDIKGECYDTTHETRAKNVGEVIRFAPLDHKNSAKYNPLALVREDPEFLWEDARFLADMLIVPASKNEPSWELRGKDLVACAIAVIVTLEAPKDRTISRMMDLITAPQDGKLWSYFMGGLLGTEEHPTPSPMRRAGGKFAEMPEKQLAGIIDGALQHLSAWEGHSIEAVTSASDWKPQDLRNGNKTVYICIPPGKVEVYASVLRVIIAQHIRILTEELPAQDEKEILFMLDEMPRLRHMAPIEEALEIGRQYKIKLWMFAQNVGQLKTAYPNYEGLLDSCAVRVYMNPQEETADRISKRLGFCESILEGTKKPLAEPAELTGGEFKNNLIVFSKDMKPARLDKRFYWENQ